jgi:hypothetical protein
MASCDFPELLRPKTSVSVPSLNPFPRSPSSLSEPEVWNWKEAALFAESAAVSLEPAVFYPGLLSEFRFITDVFITVIRVTRKSSQ